jgi:hypothetical protein
MRSITVVSLVFILGLTAATQAQTVGQAQNYSVIVNNSGFMLGTGLAGSFNVGAGGGLQSDAPATQFQAGGALSAGAAGGLATSAGYNQRVGIFAGQGQIGSVAGPALQTQGQQVVAGQTVGKAAGPGGAAAVQVAGGVQGQSFGMGPFAMQQGSAVITAQGGAVIGGPGSVGMTSQSTSVATNQTQFRTFP